MKRDKKIDARVEKIVSRVSRSYMKHLNFEYIRNEIFKAYNYAYEAHNGQLRLSGELFITHPVSATEILLDLRPDIYTIQACLLHDVVEDTPKTTEDIKNEFGEEVAFLCEGLTKVSKIKYKGDKRTVGDLRKMLIAMTKDFRVIFVRLSDRLHNMRTLMYFQEKKRERIALETLNLFSPIADRLGLHQFKNALDEECFKVLNPENYKRLKNELEKLRPRKETFLKTTKKKIKSLLDGEITHYEINFRVKSIYSVHKKLIRKGLTHVSELYDLFGIRIIVDTETDCYKVLGLIHQRRIPLTHRFKDYIALPKPNGYESIHTTIIGLLDLDIKQPIEIQIKTFKMLEYSEIGIAAHFEYKEKGSKIAKDIDWVKELRELAENTQDDDFIGHLKVDILKDRIITFTPNGDPINLPLGATSIDFAYSVHSDLGDHISIAKVNGDIYPLDKELKNGDIVEIITDKNKKTNPFRISFVKTAKAKNRIKLSIKKEDRELHKERGKEILNKYLSRFNLKLDKDLTILKDINGKTLNTEERLNLLEQIGNFSLTPASVVRKLLISAENKNKHKSKITNINNDKDNKRKELIIGGEAGLDYKFCKYCINKRDLGPNIVAHINRKGTFIIHKINCSVLKKVNKDRLLPVYTKGEVGKSLIVGVKILVKNEIGVLKSITEVLYNMQINIDSMNIIKYSKSESVIKANIEIFDYDHLKIERFIDRIKLKLKNLLIDIEALNET